ncbi:MAG TPA: PmoA family protein [Flavitalea sp.]|nr:PmoA family protein [Flavitalea sp.]
MKGLFSNTAISRFFFLSGIFLLFIAAPTLGQALTAEKSSEGIEVSENGKKILFFQTAPKSLNGKYERAGYVHPLYSLNGKVISEDMPADHPHHHGIFWAWHQIILNGKFVADGWTSKDISWKPTKVDWKKSKGAGTIRAELAWNLKSADAPPRSIVKENTLITIFKETDGYRIIDFDIRLKALVDGLEIGGSDNVWGYGGFSPRLTVPKDLSFTWDNKPLYPPQPVNTGVYASWVDFRGSFEGEPGAVSGVAVFPKHPRRDEPVSWILNLKSSMQNVRYPGRTPIPLSRKGLRLQYRVIVHDGKLSNETLVRLYEQYMQLK